MSETERHSDELTDDGIKTNHPDVTMIDYKDLHGQPVVATDSRVVFCDQHGHELNEWAEVLDMDRSEFSQRMHELAREVYDGEGIGDPWSYADPVVFDAETFEEEA